MSNNHMTPEWVVENFLPDYSEYRLKEFHDFYCAVHNTAFTSYRPQETKAIFIELYFPEALAELLKAQREECQKIAQKQISDFSGLECGAFMEIMDGYFSVLSAPIPEPKNR